MKKILLTSGGTRVPVDRVRHLGNMSHGTFGSRIAWELLEQVARMQGRVVDPDDDVQVTFMHANWSLTPFTVGVQIDPTKTSRESAHGHIDRSFNLYDRVKHRYDQYVFTDFSHYATTLEELVPEHDVVVLAAAVSDYLVANYVDGKIRSREDHRIELAPAPKLIASVKKWNPRCRLIGFKLLVDSNDTELIAAAEKSVAENGCEVVVANDLMDILQGDHRIIMVEPNKVETFWTNKNNPNYLAGVVAGRAWEMRK